MPGSARLGLRATHLMRAAQTLGGAAASDIGALCEEILTVREAGWDFVPGASCLNGDGLPLQLCLSSGHAGVSLRLIGDPGTQSDDLEERFRRAEATARACIERTGSEGFGVVAARTLARLVPREAAARAPYRQGPLWVAVSPDHRGMAFYVEAGPLDQERGWSTALGWLTDVLPSADVAATVVSRLGGACVVASMGLEGRRTDDARAKVYFRLADRTHLGELGLDLLVSDELVRFLHLAMGDFGVDLKGLVMSVGFALSDGSLVDCKIDLCGHCLRYTDDEWVELIDRLGSEFGLTPPPVAPLLKGECAVAFIGLGLDVQRSPRLNVYLNAAQPSGAPTRDELESALVDGARYLRSLQRADGAWTDYRLPVGASDQWVTAYVGVSLAQCADRSPGALEASARAATWLAEVRSYDAGWGYNALTGPDADSTAMAIALLNAVGREPEERDQAFLRARWHTGAGVSTYDGPGAWGRPHWDVTPMAYLGMSRTVRDELRHEFLQALAAHREPDGLWRSYWWRNPFYSTFVTLEALGELGIPEPEPPARNGIPEGRADNAFDLACCIGIRLARGDQLDAIDRELRTLLDAQAPDGRWPGHANLRVTENTCYAPWDEPAGAYYADEAATVTTATVVRVLARALAAGLDDAPPRATGPRGR